MHVILLGASPETALWQEGPKGSWDLIICADGGLALAYKWGLDPDLVLGDGDSYGPFPSDIKRITYPAEKNETDSELAISKAMEIGATKITLVDFLGGRLDHTLANLFYIASITDVPCTFCEKWGEVFFARETDGVSGKKDDLLSLIPIAGDVEGVTTEGLKYPLFNETLFMYKTRGISNVLLEDNCTIKKKKGNLLIVHLRGENK